MRLSVMVRHLMWVGLSEHHNNTEALRGHIRLVTLFYMEDLEVGTMNCLLRS